MRCQYSVRVVAGGVRQPNPHLPAGRTHSVSARIAQRLNGLDTDEAPSSCSRPVHISFALGGKTEDKQRFSADAGTITRQQEGSKAFMTSGGEKLTLSEASNCLRARGATFLGATNHPAAILAIKKVPHIGGRQ